MKIIFFEKMNKNSERISPVPRFFTLVELLVVIAVIAILAGMLLPALRTAKDVTEKIYCLGNLKNIGILEHSYIGSYGWVTPSFMKCGNGDPAGTYDWETRWYRMLLEESGNPFSQEKLDKQPLKMSSIIKIFFCSRSVLAYNSSKINRTVNLSGTASYGMYNINNGLGAADMDSFVKKGAAPWKISVAKNPSEKAHIFDYGNNYDAPINYFSGNRTALPTYQHYIPGAAGEAIRRGYRTLGTVDDQKRLNDLFYGRHTGSSNLLFLDGHAAFVPAPTLAEEAYSAQNSIKNIGRMFRPLTDN